MVDSISIPVFANGDITQLSHVDDICSRTGARGEQDTVHCVLGRQLPVLMPFIGEYYTGLKLLLF